MWKKNQYVGIGLIIGLLLISASAPNAIAFSSNPIGDIPLSPTTLQSASGELDNEPWNVHPNYRWDSEEDIFDSRVENSQFQLTGVINDTQESASYYREASSMDDKVKSRWVLNSTADMLDNETDFYIQSQGTGVDGWNFGENTLAPDVSNLAWERSSTVSSGILEWACTGTKQYTYFESYNYGSEIIDSEIYTHLIIRTKTNTTNYDDIYYYPKDGSSSQLGTVNFYDAANTYEITTWDISSDADWSGIETGIRMIFENSTGNNISSSVGFWVDYVLLVGNSQYQGDYAIQLAGFNATTQDGDAFLSTNAYPFNSTHYVIRPGLSTNDGANNRSWNIDADYQDYLQIVGDFGYDGCDWSEGSSSDDLGAVNTIENGYIYRKTSGWDWIYYSDWHDTHVGSNLEMPVDFHYMTVKLRCNDSANNLIFFVYQDGSTRYRYRFIDRDNIPVNEWFVFIWDWNFGSQYGGFDNSLPIDRFTIASDGGNHKTDIDYIRMTNYPYALETMDYAVFSEAYGNDGWDFDEGLDGYSGLNNLAYSDSILTGTMGAVSAMLLFNRDLTVDASIFTNLTIRVKANVSDISIEPYEGALGNSIGAIYNLTTEYQIISWDLSDDADWSGIEAALNFRWDEVGGDGDLEATDKIYIDWILLTYTNLDLNEIDLFEYETYYRLEMSFDLRSSEIDFTIFEDNDEEIITETLGDFALFDYFTADELLFDIFLSEVGLIDHWFGIINAGANTTVAWDFYEADFLDYTWKKASTQGTATWNTTSPYSASMIDWTKNGLGAKINYTLCVPDFDSCSGRLVNNRPTNGLNLFNHLNITMYSKNPSTGIITKEIHIRLQGSSASTVDIFDYSTPTNAKSLESGGGRGDFAEATFSIHYDKFNKLLTIRVESYNYTGGKEQFTYAKAITNTHCNEWIIAVCYYGISNFAAVSEGYLILEDFDLLFRDNWLPDAMSPDIDTGGAIDGVIDTIAEFFRSLIGPIVALYDLLSNVPRYLADILRDVGDIAGEIPGIGTALEGMFDTLGDIFDGIQDVVSELEDIALDLSDMATDIADMVLDIGAIWGVIETLVTDIIAALVAAATDLIDEIIGYLDTIATDVMVWIRSIDFFGVTLGDLLDFLDVLIGFISSTIGTSLDFVTMVMVDWGPIFMAGVFAFGFIFASLTCSHPGEFFEKLIQFFTIRLTKIPIIDFPLHLGTIVIPYVLFVVFLI